MQKLSGRIKDYRGKVLGGWKVLSFAGVPDKLHATWKCECTSCGAIKVLNSQHLYILSQYKESEVHSCRTCSYKRQTGESNLKPYESLYNWLIKQATRTGRLCTITYKQFLNFTNTKNCHYCGNNIEWTRFNINKNSSSYHLDRKDNYKGYTKKNCLICCAVCNKMKGTLSYKDFVSKIRQISRRTPWTL
jgi:hypothetical protein